MDFEIKKLTPDLLDDWLYFFDHVGFADNGDWPGCYCMCYHWDSQLDEQFDWDTEVYQTKNPRNRNRAIHLIKTGVMQGYLAYHDGKAVGWCNANDKAVYRTVVFDFPWVPSEIGKKVKAIVCFCIAPKLRGYGIASQLLQKICADAKADGYEYIEAYPFTLNEYNQYHGSLSLYKRQGFEAGGETCGCTIVRKYL